MDFSQYFNIHLKHAFDIAGVDTRIDDRSLYNSKLRLYCKQLRAIVKFYSFYGSTHINIIEFEFDKSNYYYGLEALDLYIDRTNAVGDQFNGFMGNTAIAGVIIRNNKANGHLKFILTHSTEIFKQLVKQYSGSSS